jgi:hypothetical protein
MALERVTVQDFERMGVEPRSSEKLLETVIARLIAREVELRNELDLTASARELLEELADGHKKAVDTRRVGE